jgi:hypothetical protein
LFGGADVAQDAANACCAPAIATAKVAMPKAKNTACCG